MLKKIIIYLFSILLVFIIQWSFINALPFYLDNLNFILIVLIFILGIAGIKNALIWAMGVGLLLDIYSFLPFGTYLVIFFIIIIFTNLLLNNLFTNRSLYSFVALTSFAIIIYEVILFAAYFFYSLMNENVIFPNYGFDFWLNELIKLSLNLCIVFIIYYFLTFFTKRLRPVFLTRKK
jgi:rod shape-determining protein MreD